MYLLPISDLKGHIHIQVYAMKIFIMLLAYYVLSRIFNISSNSFIYYAFDFTE